MIATKTYTNPLVRYVVGRWRVNAGKSDTYQELSVKKEYQQNMYSTKVMLRTMDDIMLYIEM